MDCRLFALKTEEVQEFLPCSGGETNRRRRARFEVLLRQALFRYALWRSRPGMRRNYFICASMGTDNRSIVAEIIIAEVQIISNSQSSKTQKEEVNGNMAKRLFQG